MWSSKWDRNHELFVGFEFRGGNRDVAVATNGTAIAKTELLEARRKLIHVRGPYGPPDFANAPTPSGEKANEN